MKRNRMIRCASSAIAILLTVAIISSTIKDNTQLVFAKPTLPGVETITLENGEDNPFVILEVVPDKEQAALGYLIGGEEPIINGK